MGSAATKAKRRYADKAYDRVVATVKAGEKEQIKARAEQKGYTLSGYINALIYEDMGIPCPIDIKKDGE